MSLKNIVIVSAKRTPTGSFQGALSPLSATDLGAHVLKETLKDSTVLEQEVDAVFMGCVLSAGLGQAPARQAALKAGLLQSTHCTTVNKVCGSGLKTVMLALDSIQVGSCSVVLAGGMESMSNAPYLSQGARSGLRMGHHQLLDHMMWDGLQDAMSGGTSMGLFAEELAQEKNFSRDDQDAFAKSSGEKALTAQKAGFFTTEIAPLEIKGRKETILVSADEPPQKVRFEKIPILRPAFKKEGTLTAANSSSIADGAAAVLLTTEEMAHQKDLQPLARIVAHGEFSREPEWFTLAPVGAIETVLKKANWTKESVDLFEINEAFGVVAMACAAACQIPLDKVNVHGGACALGHPIGASGARLLVTLIHALKTHGKKRGIATLCIGGGEAVALAIETL
ncbi:MAG TPA: acetyl-CoA C-acetyltransferase [Holosporales bacterium]|nr:acetyl-CoA C-acetyltransferase [Holosporales bacterium]